MRSQNVSFGTTIRKICSLVSVEKPEGQMPMVNNAAFSVNVSIFVTRYLFLLSASVYNIIMILLHN